MNGCWVGIHRDPDMLVKTLRKLRRRVRIGCLDMPFGVLFIMYYESFSLHKFIYFNFAATNREVCDNFIEKGVIELRSMLTPRLGWFEISVLKNFASIQIMVVVVVHCLLWKSKDFSLKRGIFKLCNKGYGRPLIFTTFFTHFYGASVNKC